MNRSDEEIRGALNDALTAAGVDVRNLAIEVAGGRVTLSGSVPDETQRQRIAETLAASLGPNDLSSRINIQPVTPPDSSDGRGRSPITGTSADSANESRHQLD